MMAAETIPKSIYAPRNLRLYLRGLISPRIFFHFSVKFCLIVEEDEFVYLSEALLLGMRLPVESGVFKKVLPEKVNTEIDLVLY